MIKILFALLLSSYVSAQNNIPTNKSFNESSIFSYNLLTKIKRLNVSFTHKRIPNWDERVWEQNFLNLRYKLNNNWQFGIGHGHQRGDRSNSDWQEIAGVWQWKDTTHRVENLSDITLNYRTLLKSVIFEWRNTYRYNHHFDTQRGVSRFSFNYYPMKSFGKPSNIILAFEGHKPFNPNETIEEWGYLMWLVHLNQNISLGPKVVYFRRDWESTDEFKEKTGDSYDVFEEMTLFGIQLINRF